jgi:hypothetical protein
VRVVVVAVRDLPFGSGCRPTQAARPPAREADDPGEELGPHADLILEQPGETPRGGADLPEQVRDGEPARPADELRPRTQLRLLAPRNDAH